MGHSTDQRSHQRNREFPGKLTEEFLSFARHQFTLGQTQEDGARTIDHLLIVWENTGEMPTLLRDAPELPPSCSELWATFLELHECRGSTSFGMQRITFVDIDAWQRIRGTALSSFELDCIRKADTLWLSEFAPKPKPQT